jgi:endonuclease/exonuclease/phosphatase family metal-dependent hydrolase
MDLERTTVRKMLRTTLGRRRFLTLSGAAMGFAFMTRLPRADLALAQEAPFDHPRPLRVASYNVHHGAAADCVVDLERIAQVLESLDLAVIGIQEIDRHWSERSNFVDQPGWLAERLGMYHVFAANLDRPPLEPGQPNRQYGTTVLSRFPITSWHNTLLPKFPRASSVACSRWS